MSAPIRGIDTENRQRVTAPARPRAPEPQSPSAKPDADSGQINVKPSTSYAAMLKEAYDGDASEAMAVMAHARRTGEPGGNERSATVAERRKGAAARALPIGAPEKSAQVLEGLRNRKNAGAVTAGRAVASGSDKARLVSAKRSHDQLMLASSKMGVSEVATHVSLQAFRSLTRILLRRSWQRKQAAIDNLMRAHMRNLLAAGTR